MAALDEMLPVPSAAPFDGDDALEAALHAVAALAAGMAAMQLISSAARGDALGAAFFLAVLLGAATCAFIGRGRRARRLAHLVGGAASVVTWLAVVPLASGASAGVAFGMAAASFCLTRALVGHGATRGTPAAPANGDVRASDVAEPRAWIDDDREGTLGAAALR